MKLKNTFFSVMIATAFALNVNAVEKEHIIESVDAKVFGSAVVSEVTSIYDGDTFRVNIAGWPDIAGHHVPVRVFGIDTPEMKGKCPAEKEGAQKAKQFTVEKLRSGKKIELRNLRRDKYFRLLSEVYIDNNSLAEMLIKAGLAIPYDGTTKKSWCN
jgi:endonuclease YncB( thermonuclease family)